MPINTTCIFCMQKIILASQSPRRKQLLEWAEVPFDIVVKSTEETFPADMPLSQVPIHIANEKAKAVKEYLLETGKQELANRPILAADTIVVLGNRVIGKPSSREDAISILTSLSGKTHLVITGVTIMFGKNEIKFSDTTEVSFHELSSTDIIRYVDTYKPYDKAGAYAIQEWIGVTGIRSIKGDFYNVMGLPVSLVVKALLQLS